MRNTMKSPERLPEIMKRMVITPVLAIGVMSILASPQMYVSILDYGSIITLYDKGRADWYDCEVDETHYGHYWKQNDSLYVETFCSSYCHEDHVCVSPRIDVFIEQPQNIFHVGYQEFRINNQYNTDSIYYFSSPLQYNSLSDRKPGQ